VCTYQETHLILSYCLRVYGCVQCGGDRGLNSEKESRVTKKMCADVGLNEDNI